MYTIYVCILYYDNNTHATINSFIRNVTSEINIYNVWSNSNTIDVLTPYDERLACDNFDNKKDYNVHCNTSLSWIVLNKEAGSSPIIDDSASTIQFD